MDNAADTQPRPLRVTLACDYSLQYLGGAQTAFVRQVNALHEMGWDVQVIAPGATGIWPAPPAGLRIREPRVKWQVPGLELPILPSKRKLTHALKAAMQDHASAAVIVHSEFALAAAALTAAAELGIPFLQTVHTFFWRAPRILGFAAPLVTAAHCALTGLPRKPLVTTSTAINNALRSITLRIAARADMVLSPSKHQADAIAAAGVTRVRALSNVTEPLAHTADAPSTSAIPGKLRLVWAGRFAPEKRLPVALTAVSQANQQLHKSSRTADSPAITLDVAGGVTEAPPGVTMHGRRSSAEVGELINKADAVLLTSLGFDNQPMIALEAFARGKPLIVTDPVLAHEFGDAAIQAAGTDAAGLAETLTVLAQDHGILRGAGAAAQKYAVDRTPAAHAQHLAAAIQAATA